MQKLNKIILLLDEILDSIHEIEETLTGLGYHDYTNNRKVKIFIVEKFEEIILKVISIPQEVKDNFPGDFWNEIVTLQSKLLIPELGLDEEIVWNTAKKRLKSIYKQIDNVSMNIHKNAKDLL